MHHDLQVMVVGLQEELRAVRREREEGQAAVEVGEKVYVKDWERAEVTMWPWEERYWV
jgi:hypothetical protein